MTQTTNLQVDIDEAGLRGSGQEVARIAVVEATSFTRSGSAPTITMDCVSYEAFEQEVGRLKEELDEALSAAGSHFQATRVEQAQVLEERRRRSPGTGGKPHIDAALRVADVMTAEVKTVGRNDRLSLVDELMKTGRFRHVVVLDDEGEVCGVVSQRDIFYGALAWSTGQGKFAHDNALDSMAVKEIMQDDPQVVSPEVPLSDAAALMIDKKVGCLPVVDGDQLSGIVTEGDFLMLIA